MRNLKQLDQEAFDYIIANQTPEFPIGRGRLANKFGVSDEVSRGILRRITSRLIGHYQPSNLPIGVKEELPSMTQGDTSCALTSCTASIKSPEDLCNYFNLDMRVWRVTKQVVKSYQMGYCDANKKAQAKTLFGITLTLERNKELDASLKVIEQEKEAMKTFKPLFSDIKPFFKKATPGKHLVVSFPDVHLGNYSFKDATSFESGTESIIQQYKDLISFTLNSITGQNIEKIWYIIGNDFFHTDYNQPYTTSRNHLLSEDLPWWKTFKLGRELLVSSITALKSEIAPVHVSVIPGNHDKQRSFYLGDSLECWFNSDPYVDVDNSLRPRKYISFGNVLLGATHGKEERLQDLPLIMATEHPEFSTKKFREFYLGHIHRKKEIGVTTLDETNTIRIRHLSSICTPDDWHHAKGYKSLRSAELFQWDVADGLERIYIKNI